MAFSAMRQRSCGQGRQYGQQWRVRHSTRLFLWLRCCSGGCMLVPLAESLGMVLRMELEGCCVAAGGSACIVEVLGWLFFMAATRVIQDFVQDISLAC
eukprot:6214065-Pleurochrysis_carterae.AAC.4